jgi:hypothetical protein
MPSMFALAACFRHVKLFLTDVDGALVWERRLLAGFAAFERPKPVTNRRSIFAGRDSQFKERQRRSIFQPRVGAARLPWVCNRKSINPEGVESHPRAMLLQPFQGCDIFGSHTQGSLRGRQPWADGLNAVGVPRIGAARSVFGVGCSMLDVAAFTRHARV